MLRFDVVHHMLKTSHTEEAPFVTVQEPFNKGGPLTWEIHLVPDDADELARRLVVEAAAARKLKEMMERKAVGMMPQSINCGMFGCFHDSRDEAEKCRERRATQ